MKSSLKFYRRFSKPVLILGILAIFSTTSYANELKEIQSAKKEFEQTKGAGGESARLAYVNKLAHILGGLIAAKMESGKEGNPNVFDLIYAELKQHPAPKNSDSGKLSRLRAGKWESPRHDYLYRSDGTWTMLPLEDGATSGFWRIRGNQYSDGVDSTFGKSNTYTIILLAQDVIIFTNGSDVFYEHRTDTHK